MDSGFGFHRPLGTRLFFSVVLLILTGLAMTAALPRAAGGAAAPASATATVGGLAPDLPTTGTEHVRVAVWLADQSALLKVQRAAPLRSDAKKDFAAWERDRNRRFRGMAASIAPAVRERQRVVIARLRALGARVESTGITPNVIVASIAAGRLRSALAIPGVGAIEAAPSHARLTASAIDGSPTWHAAGCTGAGSLDTACPANESGGAPGGQDSPDGKGGPDVGIYEEGVNLFHAALFRGAPGGRNPRILTPSARNANSNLPNPCPNQPEAGGYRCGHGTKHGNAIAAIIASTDGSHLGMAPGVDKILDSLGAVGESQWFSGVPAAGDSTPADLPEATVYAAGATANSDDSFGVRVADLLVSLYGIARSGAAGNDGPSAPGGPLRVSSPCIAWNAICMGGLQPNGDGRADDVVAGYSSRGPSPSGRKKPDLLAYGRSGCPSDVDETTWLADCGEGTSFAAPRGAAGAALLASSGITDPAAQRALLINSAFMVPSQHDAISGGPARYWTPDAGWGALDLEQAFAQRANVRRGSITGSSDLNSSRFFRIDDAQAGDRVTLAWNRRVRAPFWPYEQGVAAFTLTNLDLFLFRNDGDTTGGEDDDDDFACATGSAPVAHCGVDAEEHSEATGPHPVAADAWDNVEQARVSDDGTAIAKVKPASVIDGGDVEEFAIAGARAVHKLNTPTIGIAEPVLSAATSREGKIVIVTSELVNESASAPGPGLDLTTGIALDDVSFSLNLPESVEFVDMTDDLQDRRLEPGERDTLAWTVRGTQTAINQISVSATGRRFGEDFQSNSPAALMTVDSVPPVASLKTPQSWHQGASATASWTSSDGHSSVANVEVQRSIDGGPFETVHSGPQPSGSVSISAGEGQYVRARVRATDAAGNTSAYRDSPLWAVDSDPPTIELGGPNVVTYGDPAQVTVRATNVGSPVQAYARTGASQPFVPVNGDTFRIASVAKRGQPLVVEAQALDSLNRIIRASMTIATRPRRSALRMKTTGRRGRKVLTVTVRHKAPGTLTLAARCGRDRLEWEAEVGVTGVAKFALGRASGRCKFTAKFTPAAPYQDEKTRDTKSFRL